MNTTYTFEQLKEDVRKEAEALRAHATKEEVEKLNLESFDPNLPSACIYGQMTGSCTTMRAHSLIAKCCSVMVDNEQYNPDSDDAISIVVKRPVSVNYMRKIRQDDESSTYLKYLSAIEAYILLPKAKNANLIAFLRGETETLEL